MKGLWFIVVGALVAVVVGSSGSEFHREKVFEQINSLNGFEEREEAENKASFERVSSPSWKQSGGSNPPTPSEDDVVGTYIAPSRQFFTYWFYPSSSPTDVEAPGDADIANTSSSYTPPAPPPHTQSPATTVVWFFMGVPTTTSWVGVGFNTKPQMKGADMVVGSLGYYQGSPYAVIADRNSPNTDGPNTMPKVDVQEDVKLTGGYIYQGWLVLEFYRMVDTLDRAEDLRLDEATYLLWAIGGENTMIDDWGRGSFPYHLKHGFGEVHFPSGQATHVDSLSSEEIHASLIMFAWMWLVVMAVATARFMKDPFGKHWPRVHIGLVATAALLTIISFGIIIPHVSSKGSGHFNSPHKFLGLVIFLSMFAQIALGLYSYFTFDPQRELPPYFPDKTHWWLGRFILLAAFLNIFAGLWEFSPTNIGPWIFFWLWLCSLLGLLAALEFFHRGDVPSRSTQEKEYELMEQGILVVEQNNEGLKLTYGFMAVVGLILTGLCAFLLE